MRPGVVRFELGVERSCVLHRIGYAVFLHDVRG